MAVRPPDSERQGQVAAYAPGLVRRVAGWLGGKLQDWGYTLALWKWSKRPTSDDV